MNEEDLPRHIKSKESTSMYLSEYSIYYMRQKSKGNKSPKGLGKEFDKLVLSQSDFKETINDYFEENKL